MKDILIQALAPVAGTVVSTLVSLVLLELKKYIAAKTKNEEIQAALADHIAQYETNWADSPIPALRGLTPRQAAADPTRREDLERLLAEFPSTGSPLKMDAQRLRQLLGL